MNKHEKIIFELKILARAGQKRVNLPQFFQLARKHGIVRGQLIKEHLLTCIAQDFIREDSKPRLYVLNHEMLGVKPRTNGLDVEDGDKKA